MKHRLPDFRAVLLTTSLAHLLCITLLGLTPLRAPAAVKASRGELTLPTYPWTANKHPLFRGTDGKNIYPYPMLDFLSRDKTNRTYRTVVLENEYLRITFLPELGGKIHEVIDKTTGQPMFYVNHVIKPGLIGQCGAWTSGGVEWNTGPQGHTVSAMQPVACEILPPEKDGSRSVAIGETERIYGTKWTVVVTLRPGRSFIEERIRIYNPTEYVRPYYFWNCTAVPNTPGFRFIYPMTLGTDHGSEKFFNWPIDHGKDLTRGTNYQDCASIFAWHCDQDFFGSYDDGADRGVVSYANHYQVPGKKAWTWGQGGFGKMHQADLTDTDGPYNEVQTGPLLTQGEVGRLDPCEAVEWKEWWYPVHGIGGFTFANKNVAVNASTDGGKLLLRLLGTGIWSPAEVCVTKGTAIVARARCKLAPRTPVNLSFDTSATREPFNITVTAGAQTLAQFRLPLDLPRRTPPEKKPAPQTASEIAETGWKEFLFAKHRDAEKQFRQALEKDPKCVTALLGLAFLHLDDNPAAACQSARAAREVDPNSGRAAYALAVAEVNTSQAAPALDHAWKAALDPATAVPARALVAKLLLRQFKWDAVISALSEPGPWQSDGVCRNHLALALLKSDQTAQATLLARSNLAVDPLDAFAASILSLSGGGKTTVQSLVNSEPMTVPNLIADFGQIGQTDLPRQLFGEGKSSTPIALPWRSESLPALRSALERNPTDGHAALYLGHLLLHLGRHAEGRAMWQKAAELGAEPVIAYRALGMAAKTLDGDLKTAREWLEKASQADPSDSIVARDLATVLFALADKTDADADRRALSTIARDRLHAAFPAGKGRSDFVALLARAHNRLGEFAESARMLDSVRVTVWEGSHEVHDLFVEAHLALGEAHLKAGLAAEALAEFNRALDYPENLATGRTEEAREADVQYQRGLALAALGRKSEAVAAWKKAADEPASKDSKKEAARRKAREALATAPQ